jgi:ElaB/YqjD/DUF883 family membrane-anchored ribosome-binding protein
MTEEQNTTSEGARPAGSSTEDNWKEVGRQFETLGQSLAQAVRTAWENEENQRRVQELRTGLESMVRDVGKAIDDSANTPQGQKIRQDAGRAVESLRNAGEQTVQEVRPQLIRALEQVNTELQKLIDRMQPAARPEPPAPENDQDPKI